MSRVVGNIKWIMIVSGVLTCTMIYAAVAPHAALQSTFGASLEGPIAEIVVRNWGVLVALIGAMLIYGASRPQVRPLVLTVAGLSKLTYIGLVLAYGRPLVGFAAGVSLAVDLVMVVLFVGYLTAARRGGVAT